MATIVLDFTHAEQVIEVREDCEIIGLHLGHGTEAVKSKVLIKHSRPGIVSRILIKTALYDQAQFDLEVKLVVEAEAKQTDTYLKAQALLLGEFSRARIVPSLEIRTDDLKAGHGATVGHVNEEELHYLMTRGLDENAAQELIVEAFIAEVKEKLDTSRSRPR